MPKAKTPQAPPAVAIVGDEEFQKSNALRRVLDALLPPQVDRAMALSEYDGARSEDQGGPVLATVLDDLATLPFLADRRVVLIRDADKFISARRESLERYIKSPAPTGTLVLVCRSFPKNTKLCKGVVAAGGQVIECRKLRGRALIDFVMTEARARRKRIDYAVAARVAELIGQEQGILSGEVEKLCLFVGDRGTISLDDVRDLVGLTREEKIFAVMDAVAAGRLPQALGLWHDTVTTDPAAVFKAVGGMAFVLRRWITAHQMAADGLPIPAIAPKVNMWGRERQLETLLGRIPPTALKRTLAHLADLDSQAKVGARSIDSGIEALLLELVPPAA